MWLEDKASYEVMIAEAWSGTARSREAGKRLVKLLRDADQAHIAWAAEELEQLLVDGAMHKARTWHHEKRPRVKTKEGANVRTTGGVRGQDATYVMLPFEDMERSQLVEHLASRVRQVETEQGTIAALRRLLAVLDKVPTASTPREACEQLGTTVEAVMAGREEAA